LQKGGKKTLGQLMGRSAVIEKHSKRLRDEIISEDQVLFILTRIGKILEFDKKKQKYPIINFYRNCFQISTIANVSSSQYLRRFCLI
jgi:hypothetical protein